MVLMESGESKASLANQEMTVTLATQEYRDTRVTPDLLETLERLETRACRATLVQSDHQDLKVQTADPVCLEVLENKEVLARMEPQAQGDSLAFLVWM